MSNSLLSKRVVLLTGATGTLGSSILPLLINNGDSVYCLIRAKNEEHLKERTQSVISFINKNYDINNLNNITWISGNIEKPNLGLTNEEWDLVKKNTTHIIHCAADLEFLLPQSIACSKVIKALDNIFTIMNKNTNCIKLDYVSTVGVGGTNQTPLLEERVTDQCNFFNSYELSKFIAEQLIYKKIDEGYKITIHRPSMIIGHSKNGAIIHHQIFYFLVKLLSGQLSFGIYPTGFNSKLDTIPCDISAKLLFQSSLNADSHGRIFHHSSGIEWSTKLIEIQQISKKNIEELIRKVHFNDIVLNSNLKLYSFKFYFPIKLLNYISKFSFFVSKNSKWKKRLELIPMLFSYSNQVQDFKNTNTKNYFKSYGIEIPDSKIYLEAVIHQYWLGKK